MIVQPKNIPTELVEKKFVKDFSVFTGKVGLFGGSFDPIHRVHSEIAHELLASQCLDSIIFIPAAQNPLKSVKPTVDCDRLAMIYLAIADVVGAFVSSIELEREPPSYTVDTLKAIREKLPGSAKLFWIIGSDSLEALPRWRDIDEIFRLAEVVCVQRDEVRSSQGWMTYIDSIQLSHQAKESLKAHFVMRRPNTVSSTAVRNKPPGLEVDALLNPKVAQYIRENHLY